MSVTPPKITSMPRQLSRRKISSLRRGPNARQRLGLEADARALWRSYKKQPLHPFVIKEDGMIVDAARRHWGAELEGDLDFEVDCLVVEGDHSEPQITTLQLVSAIHRADLLPYDKAVAIRDIKTANPMMTNQQFAEDILDIDPSSVTQYSALFERCIPEVQEAAKAGRIGVAAWYKISLAKDQAKALAEILNHSSNGNGQSASRRSRIPIPLATGTVTVAGQAATDLKAAEALLKKAAEAASQPRIKVSQSGDSLTLTVTQAAEDADPIAVETLLKEAHIAVQTAIKLKHTAKYAQTVWRGEAEGGGAK